MGLAGKLAAKRRWEDPVERERASYAASHRKKRRQCVWEHWQDFVKTTKSGCMEWQLALTAGYGTIVYKGVHYSAQRAVYILTHGLEELNAKLCVCHTCDNPSCVNPDHLFLGDQPENLSDMTNKGRRYSKVKPEDVVEIRKLYKSGTSSGIIAARYGVSGAQACWIISGRSWSSIPGACELRHDSACASAAKLDVEKVRSILRDFYIHNVTDKYALGEKYGVTYGSIRNIVLRQTWKDVSYA